eukprot:Hpha_TRINITY_DN15533_c3_g6::TRINITY_DN15533_c3_g6_i1::g.105244::m.105244
MVAADKSPKGGDSKPSHAPKGGRRNQGRDGDVVEKLQVSFEDVGFLLGAKGKTKEKIARVSGARLEVSPGEKGRQGTVEVRGNDKEVKRALRYIACVRAQRVGPVTVEDEAEADDLTIIKVPSECVGFVTGSSGTFLRQMEVDWGTLMFFLDYDPKTAQKRSYERLAIFGDRRGRGASELKVMSVIEMKLKSHFTGSVKAGDDEKEEWGQRTIEVTEKQISWILGKRGATRKKLAAASGAVVEYVGNWVYILGSKRQRDYAAEYLEWTLQQLDTPVISIETDSREDVTVLMVPPDCIAYVMGAKRQTLTAIEEEWGVMMLFLDNKAEKSAQEPVRLAIFGPRRGRRGAELKVMSAVEGKNPGYFTKDVEESFKSSDDWGTDTFALRDQELSYVLGSGGATRKKLATASNCILQIVGKIAFFSGLREERRRARRYMKWLLEQQSDRQMRVKLSPSDTDVETIKVHADIAPTLMARRNAEKSALRQCEEETETFCFVALTDDDGQHKVVICGHSADGRERAIRYLEREIREAQRQNAQRARYSEQYDYGDDYGYERGGRGYGGGGKGRRHEEDYGGKGKSGGRGGGRKGGKGGEEGANGTGRKGRGKGGKGGEKPSPGRREGAGAGGGGAASSSGGKREPPRPAAAAPQQQQPRAQAAAAPRRPPPPVAGPRTSAAPKGLSEKEYDNAFPTLGGKK